MFAFVETYTTLQNDGYSFPRGIVGTRRALPTSFDKLRMTGALKMVAQVVPKPRSYAPAWECIRYKNQTLQHDRWIGIGRSLTATLLPQHHSIRVRTGRFGQLSGQQSD
ncbi:hypothetical protein GZ78_04950 [Endozoicomonas numazuensis]|uniref:Uncharacterized protein n=1 Tax=Endozoicomonas numazuensis TaxID=1137799 RepID=A0A081NLK1_9GAMM|nr:hypothetical protein GZ78_04950 [Endozoicomonas numazuensis]